MANRWKVVDAAAAARYNELPLTNVPIFTEDDFSGCLLGLRPGQILPRHRHAHEHEVFEVLTGTGMLWLDGESLKAGPGTVIFVPAGVEHGFENDGNEPWLIRATIHQRTYLRKAVRRALDKRLGRAI